MPSSQKSYAPPAQFQEATVVLLISIVFAVGAFSLLGSGKNHWPEIKPIQTSFRFSDPDQASVAFDIQNSGGKSLYWFGCHSADFTGQKKDPFRDDEWFYYGTFDCHLHSLSEKDGNNLLSYNPSDPRENFSRALTLTEQLRGRCAEYPEWGRVRHIRVRGMLITLEFSDLHFEHKPAAINERNQDGKVLGSFQFAVRIEEDKNADLAYADVPRFANPTLPSPGSTKNVSDDCTKVVPKKSDQ